MNREIKFRAWNGVEWVSTEEISLWDLAHDKKYQYQQYTGLKDKNGKEIYEGDIITNGKINKLVEFKSGSFGVDFSEDAEYCKASEYRRMFHSFYNFISFHIQNGVIKNWNIIGNVFENRDLLNE